MTNFVRIVSIALLVIATNLATGQTKAADPLPSAKRGNPELLEQLCFGYAKKGWEIIYSAHERKLDEAGARKLAFDYFAPESVPEQQDLISRAYTGEFSTAEDFATFLQNKCFAEMPAHPDRHQYSDAKVNKCYWKLRIPQFAYVQKHGKKAAESDAVSGFKDGVQGDHLRRIVHDMYEARTPTEEVFVYWLVFGSCMHAAD